MNARRTGVVVLDFGRPDDARRAAASARAGDRDARVLTVENGAPAGAPSDANYLRLSENRGFAGGMNAGLKELLAEGCDRILLLNNDAVLEPECLQLLAKALDDPHLAAVGPVILRDADGRVESRGVRLDLRWGRVRLEGHGEVPPEEARTVPAMALSGAALMMSRTALERVGFLDEEYFFSFEDVDWCLRARRAGFSLAVVLAARARHVGSGTIGRGSPDRFYYSTRNHLRVLDRYPSSTAIARWLLRGVAVGLNLAHALTQGEAPRRTAAAAVLEGLRDAQRGRFGARSVTPRLDLSRPTT